MIAAVIVSDLSAASRSDRDRVSLVPKLLRTDGPEGSDS